MDAYEHELATRAHEAKLQAFYMAEDAERERMRPFMLLRPRMFPDGNQWCALYGENLQDGVCAFGDTPAKAATQFDIEWLNAKAWPTGNNSELFRATCSTRRAFSVAGLRDGLMGAPRLALTPIEEAGP